MRGFPTRVCWGIFSGVWETAKNPQLSRTLLSILAYLNNAVIWMYLIVYINVSYCFFLGGGCWELIWIVLLLLGTVR